MPTICYIDHDVSWFYALPDPNSLEWANVSIGSLLSNDGIDLAMFGGERKFVIRKCVVWLDVVNTYLFVW